MMNKYFPIKTDTACQLKWTWSTILLYSGETLSCHRSDLSKVSINDFQNFHNTESKIESRKLMLDGKWPGKGCEYCRNIEHAGGSSDRQLHLKIPNLVPIELEQNPTETKVTPKILEVYLNNTCNLSCLYCGGQFSSQINTENKKFAKSCDLNSDTFGTFKISEVNNQNEYLKEFWIWMENHSKELSRIHILGGEPFYQKEFEYFFEYFDKNPHPNLELNVVTNLMISKEKLINYMEKFKKLIAQKKIRRLDLTCSLDCFGPEQEYVRYGLDLNKWVNNFDYLVTLKWLVLNINQTISVLTIKTMPKLLEQINKWKKQKTINQFFSGVTPGPNYLKPFILGGDIFQKDFERIFELMPTNNYQEQEAVTYMKGIWTEIKSSSLDHNELERLKKFLNEIDRRRNTNWRELFPWIP